jgi:hypothetical protein
MGDAPYIIIKNRPGVGAHNKSIRIARFWQHKETGTVVQVVRVQEVDGSWLRIIFTDPSVPGVQLSLPFKTRENPYQPPGRSTPLMEPGFEDQYHVYHDQRSTRA